MTIKNIEFNERKYKYSIHFEDGQYHYQVWLVDGKKKEMIYECSWFFLPIPFQLRKDAMARITIVNNHLEKGKSNKPKEDKPKDEKKTEGENGTKSTVVN